MATANQTDLSVSTTWTDIAAVNTSLASVDVCIQNKSAYGDIVQVFFGGASAPASESAGTLLNRFDSISGNAANIWVRGANTAGKIGAIIL